MYLSLHAQDGVPTPRPGTLRFFVDGLPPGIESIEWLALDMPRPPGEMLFLDPGTPHVLRFSEDLRVFDAHLPGGLLCRARLPDIVAAAMACSRDADGHSPSNAYAVRLLDSERLCIAGNRLPFAVHVCEATVPIECVRRGLGDAEYHVTCSECLSIARGAMVQLFGPRQAPIVAQAMYVGTRALVVRLCAPVDLSGCTSVCAMGSSPHVVEALGLGAHDLASSDAVSIQALSDPRATTVYVQTSTPHGCRASDRVILQECGFGFADQLMATVDRVVCDRQLVVDRRRTAPPSSDSPPPPHPPPLVKGSVRMRMPSMGMPQSACLRANNVVGANALPWASPVLYMQLSLGMREARGVVTGSNLVAFGEARGGCVLGRTTFRPALAKVPYVDITFVDAFGRVQTPVHFTVLFRLDFKNIFVSS